MICIEGRRSALISNATQKELDAHRTTETVLVALRDEIGLTERDIARATGSHIRSVRRWLAGTEPNQERADRIDDLRIVVSELGGMLDARGIVAWLRNRNPLLDRERPLDVLATSGGFDQVTAAAGALLSVDYV